MIPARPPSVRPRRLTAPTDRRGGEPFAAAASDPPGFAVPAFVAVGRGDAIDAGFAAGAALAALDRVVSSEAPWLGAWRKRLALRAAVVSLALAGRAEDEAALRDAWLFRAAGDAPGPAGAAYGAWRALAARGPHLTTAALRQAGEELALAWSPALDAIAPAADTIAQSGRAAPVAAAMLMRHVLAFRADAEPLAWWAGDAMLALRLGWPLPVPLLITKRQGRYFRAPGGRIRSDDPDFVRAVLLATAAAATEAVRLADELARRAERLAAVAPQLRAKGAADAIARLLDDDAVAVTFSTSRLSRFATRRLFDRLLGLGAVRELSGRSQFRIFGL